MAAHQRCEINAAFWGGVPGAPAHIEHGRLTLADSGLIEYRWYLGEGGAITEKTAIQLSPDQVRAMSIGTGDATRPGGRDDLKLLCDGDGEPFVAIFAAKRRRIRAFAQAVNDQRRSMGEAPLVTIEALLASGIVRQPGLPGQGPTL